MIYFLLKTLHIGAVVVWIGGTVTVTALMHTVSSHHVPAIKRFYSQVITPAMLLTWIFGMTLVLLGGWFPTPWLIAKIAIVFFLSALHGITARDLRRAELEDEAPTLHTHARRSWIVAGGAFVVIALVTFKF